ncbi:hypothetical protein MMC27_007134 [Xylographa pallens]|nr:hypothetical protein [Xylographa pallens]
MRRTYRLNVRLPSAQQQAQEKSSAYMYLMRLTGKHTSQPPVREHDWPSSIHKQPPTTNEHPRYGDRAIIPSTITASNVQRIHTQYSPQSRPWRTYRQHAAYPDLGVAIRKSKIERLARQLATDANQNPNHWEERKADAKKVHPCLASHFICYVPINPYLYSKPVQRNMVFIDEDSFALFSKIGPGDFT